GRLQSQFEYRRGDRPLETSFEQVVAAVLTGRTVALPDFSLAASGEMDLPRLAPAVPALLNLREGGEVTEGRLVINDLSLRGGSEPAAQGSIELTEVRARHNGRAIELEPMIAALDVVV